MDDFEDFSPPPPLTQLYEYRVDYIKNDGSSDFIEYVVTAHNNSEARELIGKKFLNDRPSLIK